MNATTSTQAAHALRRFADLGSVPVDDTYHRGRVR